MERKIKKLVVKYRNRIVGYLAEIEDNKIAFQYDDRWMVNSFSISPFSLPLSNKIYINSKDTFGGLYGVFADSLPDGWGELLVRRKLAKQGLNYDNFSPLEKLTLISKNGLGALTYEPCQNKQDTLVLAELDKIAEEMKKVFDEESDNTDLDFIYKLGGSSGGARPKAHLKLNGEEWIVKFPCAIDPINIGEKEFKTNQLAIKCGINVNECNLFNSKTCMGYFGAKRFDRESNNRIHMISLASLLETTHRVPNLDYLHLFQVIQQICVDKDDLYEAFKRMCFNVFVKNKDDHGKNFAFLFDEKLKGYKLSPAYDLTSTPNKAEHEMTINGNGLPTEKDLLEVAKIIKLSLKECENIVKKIKAIIN